MNSKHLETTQFLLLIRTNRFLDSRSPFLDVTSVQFQREVRKREFLDQKAQYDKKIAEELASEEKQKLEQQQQHQLAKRMGAVATQTNSETQPKKNSTNAISSPVALQIQNNKEILTNENLKNFASAIRGPPESIFAAPKFCSENETSGSGNEEAMMKIDTTVTEINKGLSSAPQKQKDFAEAVAAFVEEGSPSDYFNTRDKKKKSTSFGEETDEPIAENSNTNSSNLPKPPTMQQLLSPNALFGDFCIVFGISAVCEHLLKVYENEILAERSLLRKRQNHLQKNREAKFLSIGAKTTPSDDQDDKKVDQQQEEEPFILDDSIFDEPSNDLSTTYPLTDIPTHFQYDGGVLMRFLDSLPMLSVLELSSSQNQSETSGGSGTKKTMNQDNNNSSNNLMDEPRYVPRGLLWIKAHLLHYLESRAKNLEKK
jgi:hypothetical protein